MMFSAAEWAALALSLKVSLCASLFSLPFAIALAWVLARTHFWGKSIVSALVHLPLVLPPVVTGYGLLLVFGRQGVIGGFL
ncbi:MAG: molybdate ABC transporter permease subunit, partial [Marinovum sp.]|nr:molybdate ABC transporter permease subunit [Marinovum sp.]